jgi:hypothetical protein
MERTDPYVLIQGPKWGDAQFYGGWLLAASKAETFWKEAYADPDFKKQIDHVCVCYIPDFGIAAERHTASKGHSACRRPPPHPNPGARRHRG